MSRDEVPRHVLDAARHGDSEAFMKVYDTFADRLRGLAFRTLGDASLLDDAMQDVAVKAFRGLHGFRGDSSIGTWLYQVTFTTCLNLLRGHSRAVPVADVEALLEDPGSDPTEALLLHLDLADAFASLSPEHRAVVFLVLEMDLDYRTAGRILGVPAGTIASRLSVARTRLACCLGSPPDEGKVQ